jgi:hypothetical protein
MPDAALLWPVVLSLLVLGLLVAVGTVLLRVLASREDRLMRRMDDLTRRLAQLEKRSGQPAGSSFVSEAGAASSPASTRAREAAAPVLAASGTGVVGNGSGRPKLISVPDLGQKDSHGNPQAEDELGQKHKEVWSLVNSGIAPEEIARQTGQPIGEVELIVGLHRRLHLPRGSSDHVRP